MIILNPDRSLANMQTNLNFQLAIYCISVMCVLIYFILDRKVIHVGLLRHIIYFRDFMNNYRLFLCILGYLRIRFGSKWYMEQSWLCTCVHIFLMSTHNGGYCNLTLTPNLILNMSSTFFGHAWTNCIQTCLAFFILCIWGNF